MATSAQGLSVADPLRYFAAATLRDGESICIRSVRPDDKARLQEHFHSLSPDSVYRRFFGPKRELSPQELAYYTEMDGDERVGLVATLGDGEEEKIVGVGRYFRLADAVAPHRAEVAFAVSDRHQRRGIATLLLDHLARLARAAGITEFSANVLADNHPMLDVFASRGFALRRTVDHGVFHLLFPTAEAAPDAGGDAASSGGQG